MITTRPTRIPAEVPVAPAADSLRLPVYVERGGEISYRHPAAADDIRMYGFVLDADKVLLDRYCDLSFNRPSGQKDRWEAAGSHVLLNFVDVPILRSVDRLDEPLGQVREQETAIWFPVIDHVQNRMMWAVPYMFVDSDLAMVGGRETYGFPKQLGRMTIPRNQQAPTALTLSSVTLARFAPNSVARTHTVVTANRRSGEAAPLVPGWADLRQAVLDLIWLGENPEQRRPPVGGHRTPLASRRATGETEVLGRVFPIPEMLGFAEALDSDADTARLLASQLIRQNIPMILLKQFRDAEMPGAACYQAIVQVPNTITFFRGGGFLPDDYEIRFSRLAGDPVQRELGVPSTLEPRIGFWLEFSFVVQLGTKLWEYEPA
jgi:Acetoacetate decarboxylase (ADC)